MSDLRKNLQREMDIKGWNAYDLSEASGVPQPTIQRFLSGKHGEPRGTTVKKIASGLGTTEAKLRGFIGQATSQEEALPITVLMSGNTEPAPAISSSVPLISWVQAGSWQEVIDNLHPGDAEEWIETTAKVSNQSFALRIKGDSMTNPYGSPSLPEGSLVIIDPNAHCDNGNIVVARLDDSMEATIKKLVIDGGQRYLKPLNPAYPTTLINGNCRIIGRAVRVELDL